MITNEQLAEALVANDPTTSDWIYNRYCGYCGRYAYPDDITAGCCKKCNTSLDRAVLRSIPFATSATAIEKLTSWAIECNPQVAGIILQITINRINGLIDESYKEVIVNHVYAALAQVP